jgi:sugar/nucleoside kinase (ribokinase family)
VTADAQDPVDVVVVGHATMDLERVPGRADVEQPGGAVLYAATAAARLGARTMVLTRAPPRWAVRGLEAAAEAGAEIVVRPSTELTRFQLEHSTEGADRRLRVTSVAPPFRAEDLRTVRAHAIVLGPLTPGDFDPAAIAEARARSKVLALGVQGMVRRIGADGEVRLGEPGELAAPAWLAAIDVLSCDAAEAAVLTGLREPEAAARALASLRDGLEVLVTAGERGAWVHAEGVLHHEPAIAPRTLVSSTGAGDTFMAAWVVARLDGRPPIESARFAAAAASLSLEHMGPLRAGLHETLARAAAAAPRATDQRSSSS